MILNRRSFATNSTALQHYLLKRRCALRLSGVTRPFSHRSVCKRIRYLDSVTLIIELNGDLCITFETSKDFSHEVEVVNKFFVYL